MSGTSVDSIDAALVKIGAKKDELLLHRQFPYPAKLRTEILGMIRDPQLALAQFTRVHYEIGAAFATAAEQTLREGKKFLKTTALHAIGSHGQTVFHDPEGKRTLQIGESALICARTGVTTVSDFRVADTAVGGDGAPLLPFYHRRLLHKEASGGVAVHNLGGISNYTYLGPKGRIFALDTGPANCLLDGAIQAMSKGKVAFDQNGQQARGGRCDPGLLKFLKEKPEIQAFRAKKPPKSTGRELFSPRLLEEAMGKFPRLSPADLLRTLTQYTVDLILESYERDVLRARLPLGTIVFAGGGAQNSFLLSLLQERLGETKFAIMETFGWNSQALEAQAFAYFACAALKGEAITAATTTGAREEIVCGKILPGRNWRAR